MPQFPSHPIPILLTLLQTKINTNFLKNKLNNITLQKRRLISINKPHTYSISKYYIQILHKYTYIHFISIW